MQGEGGVTRGLLCYSTALLMRLAAVFLLPMHTYPFADCVWRLYTYALIWHAGAGCVA